MKRCKDNWFGNKHQMHVSDFAYETTDRTFYARFYDAYNRVVVDKQRIKAVEEIYNELVEQNALFRFRLKNKKLAKGYKIIAEKERGSMIFVYQIIDPRTNVSLMKCSYKPTMLDFADFPNNNRGLWSIIYKLENLPDISGNVTTAAKTTTSKPRKKASSSKENQFTRDEIVKKLMPFTAGKDNKSAYRTVAFGGDAFASNRHLIVVIDRSAIKDPVKGYAMGIEYKTQGKYIKWYYNPSYKHSDDKYKGRIETEYGVSPDFSDIFSRTTAWRVKEYEIAELIAQSKKEILKYNQSLKNGVETEFPIPSVELIEKKEEEKFDAKSVLKVLQMFKSLGCSRVKVVRVMYTMGKFGNYPAAIIYTENGVKAKCFFMPLLNNK